MTVTERVVVEIDSRPAKRGADEIVRAERDIEQQTQRLDTTLGKLGKQIASAFGAFASLATLQKAGEEIGKFDATLTELAAATGISKASSEMGKLEEAARKVGVTTRFSANAAADALLALGKAGFDAESSVSSLSSVISLAVASKQEFGAAAETVVATLTQFGLAATDAERAVDALVVTANATTTEVTEVAAALKVSGGLAKTAGLSIEQAAAAIGTLAQQAIRGGEAGTALRNIILSLTAPTETQKKAIEDLGLAYEDVDLKGESLGTALGRLKERGLDLASGKLIFGEAAVQASLALAEAGAATDQLQKQIEGGRGTAAAFAAALGDTIPGRIGELKASLVELALVVGDAGLGKALKSSIEFGRDLVRSFAGISTDGSAAGAAAGILAKALEGAAAGAALFVAAQIGQSLLSIESGAKLAGSAMSALNFVFLKNPIVGAIALITAGLVAFRDEIVQVGDASVTVSDLVVGTFGAVVDRVVVVASAVREAFGTAFGAVRRLVSSVVDGIETSFRDGIAGRAVDALGGGLEVAGQAFVNFGNLAIASLETIVDLFGVVFGRLRDAASAFGSFSFESFSALKESAGKVKEELASALDPSAALDEFRARAAENFDKTYVQDLVAAAKRGSQEAGKELAKGASSVASAVSSSLETAGEVGGKVLGAVISDETKKELQKSLDLTTIVDDVTKRAADRAAGRVSASGESAPSAIAPVTAEATSETKALTSAVVDLGEKAPDSTSKLVTGLKEVSKQAEDARRKAEGIGDAISRPVGSALDQAFSDLQDGKKLDLASIVGGVQKDITKGLFSELVSKPITETIKEGVVGSLTGTSSGGGGGLSALFGGSSSGGGILGGQASGVVNIQAQIVNVSSAGGSLGASGGLPGAIAGATGVGAGGGGPGLLGLLTGGLGGILGGATGLVGGAVRGLFSGGPLGLVSGALSGLGSGASSGFASGSTGGLLGALTGGLGSLFGGSGGGTTGFPRAPSISINPELGGASGGGGGGILSSILGGVTNLASIAGSGGTSLLGNLFGGAGGLLSGTTTGILPTILSGAGSLLTGGIGSLLGGAGGLLGGAAGGLVGGFGSGGILGALSGLVSGAGGGLVGGLSGGAVSGFVGGLGSALGSASGSLFGGASTALLNAGLGSTFSGGLLGAGAGALGAIGSGALSGLGSLFSLLLGPFGPLLTTILPALLGGGDISANLQALGKNPIATTVGSFLGGGFRRGGVFDTGGRPIPHRRGAVVSTPSYFEMQNGIIGSIAEEAPEAILPLRKNAQGQLGVIASTGGSNQTTIMQIYAKDADSFRRSQQHILARQKQLQARNSVKGST